MYGFVDVMDELVFGVYVGDCVVEYGFVVDFVFVWFFEWWMEVVVVVDYVWFDECVCGEGVVFCVGVEVFYCVEVFCVLIFF